MTAFPLPVQAQSFALNGAGAVAGATTLVLKTFLQIDGVTPLVMADFGSVGYGTIEPGNGTLEEQISFTGISQNVNGTATLTGVKTVLFTTPYTETSGLAKTHAGSTTFVISNDAGFYYAIKGYIDTALSAGAVPATTTVNGIGHVSVAPADAANPIFIGTNDPRIPTQSEKDALVGTSGTPSSTNKFVTQQNLSQDLFTNVDQSQATQDSSEAVGEANATTKKNKIAQSFIPTLTKIRGVALYKAADTGTFTGTVTVALQADSAGSPSGVNLASQVVANATWLLIPTGEIELAFTSEYASLVAGSTYWIVITTSTSDNSNHPNFGYATAGGYASGINRYNNTTDGWVTVISADLYFKTLGGTLSQVAETDSVTGLVPAPILTSAVVDLDTTTATTSGTGETSVRKKLLPGGFFNANSGFKLTVFMSFPGANSIISVYLNGTQIISSTFTIASGLPGGKSELIFMNNNSLSAQKYFYSAVSDVPQVLLNNGSTAINTAVPAVLDIRLTCAVSGVATYIGSIIEKISK